MTMARASGILLHLTSLPGPHGSGDLGASAYHFVDWLVGARQSLWQILPLGGIGPGNSPYMSSSAFAGNVLLIDLTQLQAQGWLSAMDLDAAPGFSAHRVDYARVYPWRMERLRRASARFFSTQQDAKGDAFKAFCLSHADWLDDYALFMALADFHQWQDWCDWPPPLAQRVPLALQQARSDHAAAIDFWKFCQWCFFTQWHSVRRYANARGVRIIGDAPIFIAYMSAETWARQDLFALDADGRAAVVAGVPPDFFSADGQRWGNPLYRWEAHAAEGYAWWIERVRRIFEWVDIVRIDHFRGFAGYWEIPASEPNAVHGRWLVGPGPALFEAINRALGDLPIIAEDLGIVTPDVHALRRQFQLPGMRILQFAFGEGQADDSNNTFLPHNYEPNTVVYTGTHDNDTTLGWWHSISPAMRQHVCDYLGIDGEDIHWSLIRAACASVANTAIVPMQDVLGLDGAHRMNLPGQRTGYWEWR
ncbi:MAG: 4-alpha-glucanotransferase, partial [Rhodoferax sp.]